MISSDSLMMQILVSVAGITIMTFVAYYLSWSRYHDSPAEIRHRAPVSIDAHP
jgi:hypothetical protein